MSDKIKINMDSKVLAEQIHGNLTGRDVSDTANSMYDMKNKMMGMMDDMTHDEMQEMMGTMMTHKEKMRGEKMKA